MENFEAQLEKLFQLTKTSKISELSEVLEVSPVTIRTWRTRGKIPETAYRKAKYSDFNKTQNDEVITIEKIKNSLMEGIFSAIKIKAISLEEDAKIGMVADILINELKEKHPSIFKEHKSKAS